MWSTGGTPMCSWRWQNRRTAQSLRGGRRLWHDQLEAEHDNLRAALAWSVTVGARGRELRLVTALFWFWALRGHWNEGRARLEGALTRHGGPWARDGEDDEGSSLRALLATAQWCAGALAWYQGDLAAARL